MLTSFKFDFECLIFKNGLFNLFFGIKSLIFKFYHRGKSYYEKLKPLYTFGTEKKKKFTDLQITYRVYRR